MAGGRPWYVQGADLTHRLVVVGILGYSGYLCYGIGTAIMHNARQKELRRQQKALQEHAQLAEQPNGQPAQMPDAAHLSGK